MEWTNLELADKIISTLKYLPADCGMDADGGCSVGEEVRYTLREFDVKVDSGATKLVIIPNDKNANWVLKIPFAGTYDYEYNEYDDDSEDEDYDYDDEYSEVFHTFSCGGGECGDDYCAIEEAMCEEADENNVGHYLAHTEFYTIYHDTKYYLQEKCITAYDLHNSEDGDKVEISDEERESVKCFHLCSAEWKLKAIQQYGLEDLKRFISFGEKYNLFSDTYAERNHGYTFDGRPIIFDFSSYNE